MTTTHKLNIEYRGDDGTGYKQAAMVVLNEHGGCTRAVPPVARNIADQVARGVQSGRAWLGYGVLTFEVQQ
ncbi:hypothetical protein [Vibrio phage VP16T]|nr:hypothetical protein [Vibrio phage VP16T]